MCSLLACLGLLIFVIGARLERDSGKAMIAGLALVLVAYGLHRFGGL
jgi:hypothetical protein